VRRTLRYLALIPAAGTGTRMGTAEIPKQYVQLGSKTMLEHSIDALLSDARIDRLFVIVAPGDTRWQKLPVDAERVEFVPVGGASRAESVHNGLIAIAARTEDDDRVLVHDAARPCLAEAQLARLIDEVGHDDRGGLLAIPLADTLKRGEEGRVGATIAREGMWCAQTPQLFRVGSLRAALATGPLDDVTDEASAIERSGNSPRLVAGVTSNIKVTTPEDLTLARAILAEQGRLDMPAAQERR
jgi:2-C-methyl-D-erythritol 4-phosphate cytidylyltransferase